MQLTNPFTDPDFAEFQKAAGKASKVHQIKGQLIYQYPFSKSLCHFYTTKYTPELKTLAKEENAIYTLIESYKETKNQTKAKKPIKDIVPQHSTAIDLSQSEEELLKKMHPKCRYNIRLAARKEVTVEESDDLMAFYKILEKTGKRDKFNINPYKHYQAMIQKLAPKDKAKLYLACHKDKVIAGIIVTFIGNTATYFYGASDYKYRKLMAPYALQWTAIQEAKARNFKYYDFLGIADPEDKKDPLKGVTIFKQKFGGKLIKHPTAFDIPHKRILYLALKLKKILHL